jgi:hypothetical protein
MLSQAGPSRKHRAAMQSFKVVTAFVVLVFSSLSVAKILSSVLQP